MTAKEWLAPALAAALAFTVLLALPSNDPASSQAAPDGGVQFAFPQAARVSSANASAAVLVLSRDARTPDPVWQTPHVGILHSTAAVAVCLTYAPCRATHELAGEHEPRLGAAGFNATRVTVHAFDAAGELVLSNGNASAIARLAPRFSPTMLPQGTWYVGANATPPAGTQRLPALADAFLVDVWPLLQGLPEGGQATMATDALATYYGPLWLTLRIDALVHAP